MPKPLVAVLRAGALGDVLLALPALASLRAALPGWTIRGVGYPQSWETAGSLVDEIVSVDSPEERRFSGADLVIAWSTRKPQTSCRTIHASPYPPPGIHASDWLLQTLPADLRRSVPGPYLQDGLSNATRGEELRKNDAKRIILHPGAGAKWKRWPAEHFAELALELLSMDLHVAIIDGPADDKATKEFFSALEARAPKDLTSQVPPLMSNGQSPMSNVQSLTSSSVFIGNDSGVTHLAAALGVPTIALFGPTDPSNWAPPGSLVLRNCTKTTPEQSVIRVCHDLSCLDSIPVSAVLRALETLLKTPRESGHQQTNASAGNIFETFSTVPTACT